MRFLERARHIVDMLEDVVSVDLVERFRCEWPRPAIEIVNDISSHVVANIQIDRARQRLFSATDV